MFKKHKNQQDVDMAFWWKKNPHTPNEFVKSIKEQLNILHNLSGISNTSNLIGSTSNEDNNTNEKRRAQEECSKYLIGLKEFILRDGNNGNTLGNQPSNELMDEMYNAMHNKDLFYDLINNFCELEFEAKKEVMLIYAISLRYSKDNKLVTVDYLVSKPSIIKLMILKIEESLNNKKNYQDNFLMLGNMIIENIKYEQLNRIILKDPNFWKFFEFAKLNNFEISTESLQILNVALTSNIKLVSREFFNSYSSDDINNNSNENIPRFINNINKLIVNGTYVIKRQSIKLLTSLILNRTFSTLRNEYISSADNLKLIMLLLIDKSKNLQLESFNIFKVMIANPTKDKYVMEILIKNREKLIRYFNNFNLDNQDSKFNDEKEFVIRGIETLPRLAERAEF
ncbi:hypothetical protein TBLA_0I03140 [Henningerozyma blattae CBS 6284]|uniref:Protein HYM1 n=1 Tax=Henningerozyma blattae (strain ATCC 34711 / CBS 6284 / DSM 70876 / NBRC 10599 / NRRL Y-10934 / UCD 77-7) TaxID=1071380 RepID=I2H9B7_HENB6|nr:hypothetical protein TBLA_0I03140 [Tetrapisispora blattae CBS 6284]CCH62969.1 hypothetical protein TBLA_0I03140 [Tetrapisispora blattae CBS 6284]